MIIALLVLILFAIVFPTFTRILLIGILGLLQWAVILGAGLWLWVTVT